jgi:hypothetical protein
MPSISHHQSTGKRAHPRGWGGQKPWRVSLPRQKYLVVIAGGQTKLFKDRFRESFGDVFLVILAKFREKDCFIYFVKTNDGPLCLLGLLVRWQLEADPQQQKILPCASLFVGKANVWPVSPLPSPEYAHYHEYHPLSARADDRSCLVELPQFH